MATTTPDVTAVAAANAAAVSRREAMFASLTSRVLSGSAGASTSSSAAEQKSGGVQSGSGDGASAGGNIILYDGVCLVCNAFVNFVTDHDPEGKMHFAPLQSGQLLGTSQRRHRHRHAGAGAVDHASAARGNKESAPTLHCALVSHLTSLPLRCCVSVVHNRSGSIHHP